MHKLHFQEFTSYVDNFNISSGAVMIIGFDNLREINAIYGIKAGDEILDYFTHNILSKIDALSISRMENSDEFVLIFDNITRNIEAEKIYTTIQTDIIDVCKKNLYIYSVSCGVVFFDNYTDGEALLLCAEYALNRAKEQGKNCMFIYDRQEFVNYINDRELVKEIKLSVQNDFEGFELAYQPIISCKMGRMIGAEALLRWHNDVFSNLPISKVIEVLEESGLMISVGKFIIEKAMLQANEWAKIDPDFVVHINLSYVQFHQDNFSEMIRLLAESTKVNVNQIIFEITESGFVGNKSVTSKKIAELREIGFKIALDDFGTGYSNFIYLKDLNISIVKLDRVFIAEALNADNKMKLLSHIVDTVHAMNMDVCFEGVENPDNYKCLVNIKPEFIQGYLFGKPVFIDDFNGYFKCLPNQELIKIIDKDTSTDTSLLYLMKKVQEEEQIKKSGTSFARRLLLCVLPVLFIILFILAAVTYSVSNNILQVQLNYNMTNTLNNSLNQLDAKFNETMYLTQTTATYVKNSYKSIELAGYEKMLNEVVSNNCNIAGSGIWFEHYAYDNQDVVCPYVYRNGEELITTYVYGGPDYDYFTKDYFKIVKETGKNYISDPYFDKTMNNRIITFSCPMLDNDTFIGVITVDLYLDDVVTIVHNLNPDESTYSFLITSDGSIICGFVASTSLISLLSENNGKCTYEFDSKEYDVYYDTLESTGWKAAIMVDAKGLYEPVRRMCTVLIVTFSITMIVSIAILVFFMVAMNKEKNLEYEQKKNINRSHYNALRSSYHMILVVDKYTHNITTIYLAEQIKNCDIVLSDYSSFTNNLGLRINPLDRKSFYNFTTLNNIEESLIYKDYASDDVRMTYDNSEHWIEITVSKINGNEENAQFLFMVRDIDEIKSKEIIAQNEKQELITELQKKNTELFELGITDNLTKIYNRSGLNYYAQGLIDDAWRNNKNLFLLIADIDKLKNINDKFGHLKGDDAIKEAANILKNVDKNMIAARTGGDEFVLLGVCDDKVNPNDYIETINKLTNESNILSCESGISIGYYYGKIDIKKNIDYYYNLADSAMYKDKRK